MHQIVQCPPRRQGATVEQIGIRLVSSWGALHFSSNPFTSFTSKVRPLEGTGGRIREPAQAEDSCLRPADSGSLLAPAGTGAEVGVAACAASEGGGSHGLPGCPRVVS